MAKGGVGGTMMSSSRASLSAAEGVEGEFGAERDDSVVLAVSVHLPSHRMMGREALRSDGSVVGD